MEGNGHFAYNGNYLICGYCGSSLTPYWDSGNRVQPYKFRVYCGNPHCKRYLEVYLIGDEAKVSLWPTGVKAAVATNLAPGTIPADRVIGGGDAALAGQMQATPLRR